MSDITNDERKRVGEKLTAVLIDIGRAIVTGDLDDRKGAIDNAGEFIDLVNSFDDQGA